MSESLSRRIHGIIPPVISPLTDEGRFDPAAARRVCAEMIECGVNGLFLFGSSGEGPNIPRSDRVAGIAAAVEASQGRVPVLVGVLEPSTRNAIEAGQEARDAGADALVVCAPYYFRYAMGEIETHVRMVRERVDLPVMLYDIPVTTGVKLPISTVLSLAADDTIIGVKDSSGDETNMRRLLTQRPEGLRVLTGAELLVDTSLLAGADGSVPGLANVCPRFFTRLYQAWLDDDGPAVADLAARIVALGEVFINPDPTGPRASYAFGSMKIATQLRGVIETARLTDPFRQVTARHRERVRQIMTETGALEA